MLSVIYILMGQQIQFHLMGFSTDANAKAAGQRVFEVIEEVAMSLGITATGLDGVTIAHDYDAALAGLDTGFGSQDPLTRTNDKNAGGVAMTPCVMRNGKILSHIVLNAGIVRFIDSPANGIHGKYIIAHELSHSVEHLLRDKMLPNTLPRVQLPERDETFLLEAADMCWGEYFACLMSAPIDPEQATGYETVFVAALKEAKDAINQAKKQWMNDKDFSAVFQTIAPIASNLLKYAAHLFGHARGLRKSFQDLAPEGWKLLKSETWLLPWVIKLDESLSTTANTFDSWKGLDAFKPLKQIVRGLLADCEIAFRTVNDSLYIWVNPGKLPIY